MTRPTRAVVGRYETTSYAADTIHIALDTGTWPYRVSQRYGELLVIHLFCFRRTAEVAYLNAVDNADGALASIRLALSTED